MIEWCSPEKIVQQKRRSTNTCHRNNDPSFWVELKRLNRRKRHCDDNGETEGEKELRSSKKFESGNEKDCRGLCGFMLDSATQPLLDSQLQGCCGAFVSFTANTELLRRRAVSTIAHLMASHIISLLCPIAISLKR